MRGLLVVALVLSLGLGSTVLQVIAWATMLPAQFAETGSVTEAVSNTFDGEHACSMCEMADAQRELEQQNQSSAPAKKKSLASSLELQRYQISKLQVYPPSGQRLPVDHDGELAETLAVLPDLPPPDSC